MLRHLLKGKSMNIIIAGCSWGVGEWNLECSQILHPGLEFYLKNDGHDVVNLSCGAISNLDIVARLENYFERFPDTPKGPVIVFQTEYTRDYKHYAREKDYGTNEAEEYHNGLGAVSSRWIERFYHRLSKFSQAWDRPIKIIGGCGDTMWFDNMDHDYPGCKIVCQSLTNLLINNNHRIQQPVYSWYLNNSVGLIEKIKKNGVDSKQLNEINSLISLGFQRESDVRENPELFYPDGRHPNRVGHKILYEHLINNNELT